MVSRSATAVTWRHVLVDPSVEEEKKAAPRLKAMGSTWHIIANSPRICAISIRKNKML